MQKKALGKGLEALIPKTSPDLDQVVEIPLEKTVPNPKQPRKSFDKGQLQELADSIKASGLLQPITVQQNHNLYVIIFGERRVRASKLAGLKTIPAIVKKFPEEDYLQLALVENLQREDLNPIEKALAFDDFISHYKITQEELALRLGMDRSAITNTLRLLKLPGFVQEKINSGQLSAGSARSLLAISDAAEQILLAERIIKEQWSVRNIEKYVKKLKNGKKAKKPKKQMLSPYMNTVKDSIMHYLGTKVNISHSQKGGHIVITYYNEDDLDKISDLIVK